jgi:hypothetical protein
MNITTIQNFIYNRIKNSSFFNTVAVLNTNKGVTENDVLTALNSSLYTNNKAGVCVIVLDPVKEIKSPNLPNPTYDVTFTIRTIVDPVINSDTTYGANKDVQLISLELDRLLHHTRILEGLLFASGSEPTQFDDGKIMIENTYTIANSSIPVQAKVKTPTISYNTLDGKATLSCITDGVAIYYSTDGSYPSTLYSAPFTASSGVIAFATKANMRDSDITT